MPGSDASAISQPETAPATAPSPDGAGNGREADWGDGDLGDLLQELRVLLPGAQTLTAFLVILFLCSFSLLPLSVGVNVSLLYCS